MGPSFRERLEDLRGRAGLGAVPVPLLLAGIAACVALAALALWRGAAAGPDVTEQPAAARSTEPSAARSGEPTPGVVVVHVVGAVRRPGVYTLPKGSRACDAVTTAGGTTGNAAEAALNLARVLQDGEQLVVPTKDAAPPSVAGAAPGATGPAASGQPGGLVDINHASAADLDKLPGIGPSTAEKIVKDREANGPFASLDDLGRISGIGPKKIEALKDVATAK